MTKNKEPEDDERKKDIGTVKNEAGWSKVFLLDFSK